MINESVLLVLKTKGLIAFIEFRVNSYRRAIKSERLLNILNSYDYVAMLVDRSDADKNVKTLVRAYLALHCNPSTH